MRHILFPFSLSVPVLLYLPPPAERQEVGHRGPQATCLLLPSQPGPRLQFCVAYSSNAGSSGLAIRLA